MNGTLYFGANDGKHGYELWKSDGTAANTTLVKDINPGEESSDPYVANRIPGRTVLQRGRHGQRLGRDYHLWKSNGTETGTVLVRDSSGQPLPWVLGLKDSGGTLFVNIDLGLSVDGDVAMASCGKPMVPRQEL